MYYADSDILTILLALLTFAAGIYSSIKKGKKKNTVPLAQKAEEKSPFFSLESLFEEVEKELNGECDKGFVDMLRKRSEEKSEEESAEMLEEELESKPYEELEEEQKEEVLKKDDLHKEERVILPPVEPENNAKEDNLKSRLKASPKDIILFSEILKPKHKEF